MAPSLKIWKNDGEIWAPDNILPLVVLFLSHPHDHLLVVYPDLCQTDTMFVPFSKMYYIDGLLNIIYFFDILWPLMA